MGRDPDESRHCALNARRAGERDGAARGGRCRLSQRLAGIYPRARRSSGPRPKTISAMRSECSASERAGARGSRRPPPPIAKPCRNIPARACRSNGPGPDESRHCAPKARRAGERDGAARRGRHRLSRRLAGKNPRARAARLGRDPDKSRRCALSSPQRAGGGHGAARRGRFRLATPCRKIPARACRSIGPKVPAVKGSPSRCSRNGAAMRRWRSWRLSRSRRLLRHHATVAMRISPPSLKRFCRQPARLSKNSPSAEGPTRRVDGDYPSRANPAAASGVHQGGALPALRRAN